MIIEKWGVYQSLHLGFLLNNVLKASCEFGKAERVALQGWVQGLATGGLQVWEVSIDLCSLLLKSTSMAQQRSNIISSQAWLKSGCVELRAAEKIDEQKQAMMGEGHQSSLLHLH